MVRRDKVNVRIAQPLFWFEPSWHHIQPRAADQIAVSVSRLDVVVSALQSDLSATEDEQPAMLTPMEMVEGSDTPLFLPRMVPYRPERYGFQPTDLIGPRVVDVRLSLARDPEGHFGYSPERIARWESTPDDEPLAGGGWVPGASFPPDVPSLSRLDRKLEQLRQLAVQAAVFVSMGSHRLKDELPAILDARPDGVILRLDDIQLSGLQLAEVTVLARQMIDSHAHSVPLWVVPGPITADDAAKLLALGASAIAIDSWCDEVVNEASQAHQAASSTAGYTSVGVDDTVVQHKIEQDLSPKIERFKGLCTSMQSIPHDQRLACLSGRWAKALGIPALALPGVADDV